MSTRMLYRNPSINTSSDSNNGFVNIDGERFDYIVVEEGEEVQGYYMTSTEALGSKKSIPPRDELETEAAKLDISFNGNTKDKSLFESIKDKIAE